MKSSTEERVTEGRCAFIRQIGCFVEGVYVEAIHTQAIQGIAKDSSLTFILIVQWVTTIFVEGKKMDMSVCS